MYARIILILVLAALYTSDDVSQEDSTIPPMPKGYESKAAIHTAMFTG